jgi:hypothetical protein
MAEQDTLISRKRGPPATGKGVPVLVRLQPPLLGAVDAFILERSKVGETLSRPEAVRLLLTRGLGAAGNPLELLTAAVRASPDPGDYWEGFGDSAEEIAASLFDDVAVAANHLARDADVERDAETPGDWAGVSEALRSLVPNNFDPHKRRRRAR